MFFLSRRFRSKIASDSPRWSRIGPRWPRDGPAKARHRKQSKACSLRGPLLCEATLNRPTKGSSRPEVWLLISSKVALATSLPWGEARPSPPPPPRTPFARHPSVRGAFVFFTLTLLTHLKTTSARLLLDIFATRRSKTPEDAILTPQDRPKTPTRRQLGPCWTQLGRPGKPKTKKNRRFL